MPLGLEEIEERLADFRRRHGFRTHGHIPFALFRADESRQSRIPRAGFKLGEQAAGAAGQASGEARAQKNGPPRWGVARGS